MALQEHFSSNAPPFTDKALLGPARVIGLALVPNPLLMLVIYEFAIGTSDIPWGEALKGRPLGKSTESGKMYFSQHTQHSEKVQKALGSCRCVVMLRRG